MSFWIATLVENEPAREGLVGEHGLALLVEAGGSRVLFDTGASERVVSNAAALGLLGALSAIDAIVLSHGHYDHTGGLAAILSRARRQIPVYAGRDLFGEKVARRHGSDRPIGVPQCRADLEALGARFVVGAEPREILPGVHVSGTIPRGHAWETGDETLCHVAPGGAVRPDPFAEEQALAVETDRGLVVLVGCAHRGFLNSIAAARRAAGGGPLRAVVGGAHLRAASEERIRRTAELVASLTPERVALGHCTGAAAERIFAELLAERFLPLRAGTSLTLD